MPLHLTLPAIKRVAAATDWKNVNQLLRQVGEFMSGKARANFTRGERIQRFLMASCALVLFVLGVLLLIEPLMAGRPANGELMDNVGGTAALERSCLSA